MPPTRAACFITPHGFGHAARATAVMEAWHRIEPAVDFEVFTEVPKWFLRDSLDGPFTYHSLLTDIGMVQETPLREDLPATVSRLDAFLPFDPTEIVRLAEDVVRSRCKAVLCDIAPMGIAVAREAGIPSVLIENFTWDWIYRGYSAAEPAIEKHAAYMEKLFRSADVHVQAEPACVPSPNADLRAEPVSRRVRSPRKSIRERLGIPDAVVAPLVVVVVVISDVGGRVFASPAGLEEELGLHRLLGLLAVDQGPAGCSRAGSGARVARRGFRALGRLAGRIARWRGGLICRRGGGPRLAGLDRRRRGGAGGER